MKPALVENLDSRFRGNDPAETETNGLAPDGFFDSSPVPIFFYFLIFFFLSDVMLNVR